MAGWRKYFTPVLNDGSTSPVGSVGNRANPSRTNYSSYLPDVYSGHPNRLERYQQYDTMDSDSEVNAALDILAEFCTQMNDSNGTPFELFFKEEATQTEIKVLRKYLQQWTKLNKFYTRIFKIVRNTFKYGDAFFVRDPETQAWMYIDPAKVDKIIVNESDGKVPEQYVIRDLNINLQNLTVTQINPSNMNGTGQGSNYMVAGAQQRGMVGGAPQNAGGRFQINQNQYAIDANHVIHISLSEGLDNNFPFGNSLMESIFKVYKQKELLEDAIIIYRVQRAPERRVFYIDVGNMPSHLAMGFVERVKNEVNQRRIPSLTGGGTSVIDASYNPLSINEDYFFPQTCLALDEKIKLLDGRDLSLIDIIKEYESGKVNYAYTVNQETHEIEPGKIVWAGKTRLNTQLVEVLLDNGEKIKVTPDHRFIMRDGSEVEAQHLKEQDSLMPLYLHDATTGKHQGAGKYLKYTCNATGKKKWVHTMVCPKSRPGKDTEIHHIDLNSRNNDPTNLVEMNTHDHRDLHKKLGTYHLTNAWNDPIKRAKIIEGTRNYHANATAEDKQMFMTRGKKNGAATWTNKGSADRVRKSLSDTRKIVSVNKTIIYSDEMAARLVDLYNEGYDSITKLTKVLRDDDIFQNEFRIANPNLLRDKNRPNKILPTDTTLVKMAQFMGYNGWNDFKKTYAVNHKVVSVTWLEELEDTGDITIESKSNSHNFALTAGVFIHNSEGRGSKVEILPGGTNLGEIDDLRYFTNKLFRALRIPSSYLPTGPDDGGSSFNDGRVGTAYIQELRFNKYCERLQSLLNDSFNTEFKLFLHDRGVNVDPMLFDIKFNPPQNFAAYRQAEMDTARVGTFQTMVQIPFISKRFALKRFLGLSEEEIAENQTKWQEENIENMNNPMNAAAEMRAGGITAGGAAADLGAIDAAGIPPEGMDADMGAGEPGMGTAPPASSGAPNAGPGGSQM